VPPEARHRSGGGGRLLAGIGAAAALAVALVLALLLGRGGGGHDPARAASSPPEPVSHPSSAPSSLPSSASAVLPPGTSLQVPVPASTAPAAPGKPVSVSVPSVGIRSTLQPLGLEKDGTLEPPSQFARAGWYADGTRPGAVGPALIAGHVDSTAGPAVFFRLTDVRRGDDVQVVDDHGTTRHFVVTAIARYPKDKFPTEAVYGPSALPIVRLVTCTGDFDVRHHNYLSNLVVTAVLDGPAAHPAAHDG
jgi:hypothetical protein